MHSRRSLFFDRWLSCPTDGALGTETTDPFPTRDGLQAHTEIVVTAITLVAEHHVLFFSRFETSDASFAVSTLPRIGLDHINHLLRHVEARWV